MNVIDLFCGSGGLSYGFEQAGYNVLLGVDNDAS
jgi:DNA (cytosine-5)-methyltransferase 1